MSRHWRSIAKTNRLFKVYIYTKSILKYQISSLLLSIMVIQGPEKTIHFPPIWSKNEELFFSGKVHGTQVWTTFLDTNSPSPLYDHSPFIYFSEPLPPTFDNIFLDNIGNLLWVIYGVNTKINSWVNVISSCSKDYKPMPHSFL